MAAPSTSPPETPYVEDACFAPAQGIYAPEPEVRAALKPVLDRYRSVAHQRVGTMWFHDMPRSANDPWLKRAVVTVRFAILRDGSIDPPVVTSSSGRSSYDHHALEAVRQASPFDPLPAGITHALPLCITFKYHADEDDERPRKKDPLPYPSGAPAPRQPVSPPS